MYNQSPIYSNGLVPPPPGFNPTALLNPTQTMQPPMMAPYTIPSPVFPPPAPPQTIVIVNKKQATISNMAQEGDISNCPYCSRDTSNVMNRRVGCTTFLWCACLLFTTVGLFWIPFCCDGCKDTDVICQQCCNKKTTVQANCC